MTNEQSKDELIRQIRYIGESLIKNADSIVGNEKYIFGISISANVSIKDNVPSIHVEKDFLPEPYLDENGEWRMKNGQYD